MKKILPELLDICQKIESQFDAISVDRKEILSALAKAIKENISKTQSCDLMTICTHNSRRSHISQLCLRMASLYYKIENIHTFSGGTEATALNPRVATALTSIGFQVKQLDNRDNPKYFIPLLENEQSKEVYFSKKYNADYNPQSDYIAIMVCDSADEACPIVHGSSARFSITYIDPKVSDGTPEETETYQNKVYEIGREMFYVMKMVSYGKKIRPERHENS